MEILTGEQMRRVDRRVIDGMGVAGLLLMESAGRGVADALRQDYPELGTRGLLVLSGKGNNGGDGLVVARHLARHGIPTHVVLLANGDALRGDAAVNLKAARACGVAIDEAPNTTAWNACRPLIDRFGLVLDALLGTGIKGGARGLAATVIRDLDGSRTPVVALDIASGLDADSTAAPGVTVQADHTYTLCRPKLPIVLGPGETASGSWTVVPIGIPDSAVCEENCQLEWFDAHAAGALLESRAADTHKGDYGHLLAVAGSRGKSGAAALLGQAALRSGVGLMTCAVPSSTLTSVAAHQAELMTEPLPETRAGGLGRAAGPRALRLLEECDALAIGPGLGTAKETATAVMTLLKRRQVAAVADADALNVLSARSRLTPASLNSLRQPLVLTPHPGEASRLLRRPTSLIQADRLDAARTLARRTGAVVVLKGHRSLIAAPDGRVAVNASGNPGMATAGTGDVLTGAIGALLARGMTAWNAARLAVFVHGDAGDRAAAERGDDGLIAGDLLEQIPEAMLSLASLRAQRDW